MLHAESIAQLNSTISEFERTSGGEMAVVVIASLDGLSIEEAAVTLFNLWGIGKRPRTTGSFCSGLPETDAFASRLDMGSRAFFPTARPARFSMPT